MNQSYLRMMKKRGISFIHTVYIIYGFVLINNYKRTYDQSNQIENKFELFIDNWSYSYEE